METQRIRQLFDRYLENQSSVEEVKELMQLFQTSDSVYLRDLIENELNRPDHAEEDERLQQLAAEAYSYIDKEISGTKKVKLWPRLTKISMSWKIAAAVAAITLGTWLYYTPRHPEESRDLLNYANDIAPGHNTATITLANGKTITLSDAKVGVVIGDNKLAYNDGSKIDDSSLRGTLSSRGTAKDLGPTGPGTLTASTPRGGTYQFTLPDGTKAWLNAASSIKFPSSFAGAKQRRIEMTGEVYLEVTKDKKHPFIVESAGQQIEVLGTHFNVNAYPDEGSTKTTLLEGSVNVNGTILRPNQQASLQGEAITVKQIDPSETLAWKNGDFILNNDDFRTVMRKLSRWYNVEVIYATDAPYDLELYGEVSRSKNISAVLSVIEATGKVHFRIEGKKIYVSK